MIKSFKHTDVLPDSFKKNLFKKRFSYTPTLEIKAFDPDKEMTIHVIANAAIPDRMKEIIDTEAWDLDNYEKNPIVLLQHDQNRRVGKCSAFSVGKSGLEADIILGDPSKAPLTQLQVDTRSEVAQGILKGISVGFLPRVVEYDEEAETLRYTEVELLEISLVSIPMQQDSLVTSVKSFNGDIMSDNKTNKSEPDQEGVTAQLKELKSMASDHSDCLKDMHKSIKDLHKKVDAMKEKSAKDPDDDGDDDSGEKALKNENKKLKEKLKEMGDQFKELSEQSEALLNKLTEQGLLKKSEGGKQ